MPNKRKSLLSSVTYWGKDQSIPKGITWDSVVHIHLNHWVQGCHKSAVWVKLPLPALAQEQWVWTWSIISKIVRMQEDFQSLGILSLAANRICTMVCLLGGEGLSIVKFNRANSGDDSDILSVISDIIWKTCCPNLFRSLQFQNIWRICSI